MASMMPAELALSINPAGSEARIRRRSDEAEIQVESIASPAVPPPIERTESWQLRHEGWTRTTEEQLQGLRQRAGRGGNRLEKYYRRQNSLLDQFEEVEALLAAPEAERGASRQKKNVPRAVFLSNASNVVLLLLKIYIAIFSKSLSIVASTLDSILDLLSGLLLWYTRRQMLAEDMYTYPIGKKRVQPLGIIVFASIMGTVGFTILVEAVRQLIGGNPGKLHAFYWVVGVMSINIVLKLALYIYCKAFADKIVRAYAQDHLNDVMVNSIGLAGALLGDKVWWLDPAAAILLSIWIIVNWAGVARENAMTLVGRAPPPEFYQKLIYICWNHDKEVLYIDTVRPYTFGDSYFVEVDIVLPAEMPLSQAHDIGEALQNKLESLEEIERAFVHLDYESVHRPEHAQHPHAS
eukprot:jgi/Chlat1/2975/Chrsp2S08914